MNGQFDYAKHAKLKQQWLILFITAVVLAFGYTILLWLVPSLKQLNQQLAQHNINLNVMFLVQVLVMALLFFLEYEFIYKKNGTKWLLFILILIPTSYLGSLIHFAYAQSYYPIEIVYMFIMLPISIAYWYVCYRLYFMNRALHKIKS